MRMKLFIALLCCVFGWPVGAGAAILLNENFEYANQAAMDAVWPTSCPGNPNILTLSTAFAFSPTHSVRSVMNGGIGTCFMDRDYTGTAHVFYKWDVKFVNFNFNSDGNGSKQMYAKGPTFVFFHVESSNQWSIHVPYNGYFRTCPSGPGMPIGPQPNEECLYKANINQTPVNGNGTYCVETEVLMSSKGGNDGLLRLWANGVLVLEYFNVPIVPSNHTGPMVFNNVTHYAQMGIGTRYVDDLVVSDQRIGCSGSTLPPPDTTPPTQVTGLAVTAGGSLTWNAASDAVGVTSYNVRRCTGASCTPSAGFTTVSGTSAMDSTGVAGTVYGYSANAGDAAGNQGAYSSTVYRTAPSTYRTITVTDLFNRADGLMGASWDDGYTSFYGTQNAMALVSNQLRVASVGADSMETHNTAVGNDQWAQITLSVLATPSGVVQAPGIVLRTNAPGNQTGYACRAFNHTGTPRARIERWDGLIAHVPLTPDDDTVTWQSGDKMRCEIEGTTIRLYQIRGDSETLVLSKTDATYASGRFGIIHYVASSVPADVQVDDFLGGTISATPAVPAKILTVTNPATRTAVSGITYNAQTTSLRIATEFGSFFAPVTDVVGGVLTLTQPMITSLTDFIGIFGRNVAGEESTDSADWIYVQVPAATVDTDPCVMTLAAPTATLPSGTTAVTGALTVNKNCACRANLTDTTYALMSLDMDGVSLTRSYPFTGLSAGTVNRYARCNFTDTFGVEHPNLTSLTIPITIAADPAAVAYDGSCSNAADTTTSITCNYTVGALTDGVLLIAVADQNGTDTITTPTVGGSTTGVTLLDSQVQDNAGGGVSFFKVYYKLAPSAGSTTIASTHGSGHIAIAAVTYSGVDQSTPFRTEGKTNGTAATGTVNATTVSGDVVAEFFAWYAAGSNTLTYDVSQTSRQNSSASTQGLGISQETASGTTTTASGDFSFGAGLPWAVIAEPMIASGSGGDTTLPSTVPSAVGTSLSQSQVELVWGAATDNVGISGYQVYSCPTVACSTLVLAALPTPATTIITNNPPNTITYWCVKAIDTSNNFSAACSNTVTVTTSAIIDIEPPSDMTNLRLLATFTNSVQLTSDQMTDNQGAVTTTIELSTTGCGGTFSTVYSNLTLTHFIPNLQPATAYCVRGKGSDGHNVSVNYSNTLPFTTNAAATGALTRPRAPVPFSQPRLPRTP